MNEENKRFAIFAAIFVAVQSARGFMAHMDRKNSQGVVSEGINLLGNKAQMVLAMLALCSIVAIPLYNGNIAGPIAKHDEQILAVQQSQVKQAELTAESIRALEKTVQDQSLAHAQSQSDVMRKIDVLIERTDMQSREKKNP